jgi:hypothetical protein
MIGSADPNLTQDHILFAEVELFHQRIVCRPVLAMDQIGGDHAFEGDVAPAGERLDRRIEREKAA